jgi:GxxExxY protein
MNTKINLLTEKIIGICINIHKKIGSGLYESVYEEILCYEFKKNKIKYERQKNIPVIYEKIKLNIGFTADIIVDKKIILELKSIETILPVHKKQLLTYLKLTNLKIGLLINFNSSLLKDGITRLIN